jgi:hypothetical protein
MSKETFYLILDATDNTRSVHNASNARDLITNTKRFRVLLKGDEKAMLRSVSDPLAPVVTDEKGKPTAEGFAQLELNKKTAENEARAADENAEEEDKPVSELDVADDGLQPLKELS